MEKCIQCGNGFKRGFMEALQGVRVCSECRKENMDIKRKAAWEESGRIAAREQHKENQAWEKQREKIAARGFRPFG